ncbi:aminotransferase DegT [archaeon]|nr:aminotransferase DegT [archaeon]|tara:strand:+ start:111 stop:1172 length:1062 start_codon:yes stop_codon:yes gene_type:complete
MKIIPHSKPTIGQEEELAIASVVKSGKITQGSKVAQFEQNLADYVGKKYVIAVNSGLSALHLSLIALNIKQDDEIILPSYTCDALLNAILYLNAKPIIIDVSYNDGNISVKEIKKYIATKTKAIIVPHSFGFSAEMDEIVNLGIPLIEDCATSIGAEYKNKKTGSYGLVSIFSFYATKMLTTGEGGAIVTDDEKIAETVKELRDYTKHTEFKLRYNYKMTDICAAMGIVQLEKLDGFIDKRNILAKTYSNLLKDHPNIILPNYEDKKIKSNFYRYVIKIPNKDVNKIRDKMKSKGIFCGKGVLVPLHKLLNLHSKDYPISEKLFKENISLPIYPSLNEEDVKYISKSLIDSLI